jgi:hypothetical protein
MGISGLAERRAEFIPAAVGCNEAFNPLLEEVAAESCRDEDAGDCAPIESCAREACSLRLEGF